MFADMLAQAMARVVHEGGGMTWRFAFLMLVAVVIAGCPAAAPPRPHDVSTVAKPVAATKAHASASLPGFRLSNDEGDADDRHGRASAPTTPLSDADTKKIFARLPAMHADPADAKELVLHDRSLPPPRAGKTVKETFPPADSAAAPAVASGPLAIERKEPEGEVSIAPHLSVTFSKPVVALGAEDPPPVEIKPAVAGKWRWIGTETAFFQPAPRFPMATEFVVEARSAGAKWSFGTPPPKMQRSSPTGDAEKRDPLLYAEFDQDIEPAKMLASIELVPAAPLKLAAADETADFPKNKHWIAFRPVNTLAASTKYTVRIRSGAPSAEGPRRTTHDQTWSFTTHGPFAVRSTECGWQKSGCRPLDSFRIEMNNAFDREAEAAIEKEKLVAIAPEAPAAKARVEGRWLYVQALTKGRTTYTVTLRAGLKDEHGQTLGKDEKLTFDVGPAEPRLFGAEGDMIVLEPASPRSYPVYSVNETVLRTRLYAVTPDQWPAYVAYLRDVNDPKKNPVPPGKLVRDEELKPRGPEDTLATTDVDLKVALSKAGLGHVLLVVDGKKSRESVHLWVQSTKMAMSAFVDPDGVTGWVTRLTDGGPVQNARIELTGVGTTTTDAQGLGSLVFGAAKGTLLFAKKDDDTVLVADRWRGELGLRRAERSDVVRWLVYDDRGMYKPGEEVHLKGWVRRGVMGKGGDTDRVPSPKGPVRWRVADPRGAELAKGAASLDDQDGFDFAFALPKNANLGAAQVELELASTSLQGAATRHSVPVQEFRRPEFEVDVRASEERHVVGTHAGITASAAYYGGGGLPNAKVEWHVTRSRGSYVPPNRGDWHFGPDDLGFWWGGDERLPASSASWTGRTNAGGRHRLRIDFDPIDPPYPMALSFEATVEDVNRQAWGAQGSMLVHPADVYVGIKAQKRFVRAGEPLVADFLVTDIEGKEAPRKVAAYAARIEWDHGVEKEVDAQACETASSCTFPTKQAGQVRIVATVTDAQGRKNRSQLTTWVTGAQTARDLKRVETGKVDLVTEKKAYKPGETVQLLVVAPFAPAEGVLTLRRSGLVKIERFTMTERSRVFDVRAEDAYVPNLEIGVDVVGRDEETKMPAHAAGTATIDVLPDARRLAVKVAAKDPKMLPGGKTAIDVDVSDNLGRPAANAKVAVVVADEAILALTHYATPNPIEAFFPRRYGEVSTLDMHERVVSTAPDPNKLGATADNDADGVLDAMDKCPNEPETFNGYQDQDGCPDRGLVRIEGNSIQILQQSIAVRRHFSPLALFAPAVTTDAKGHATAALALPDNITRYRIMAVASANERQFGAGESSLVARLPLALRPSAPRFLNFGDRFELPIVVQNQTDAPLDVGLVMRATNATLTGPPGKKVVVPANDRVEVRFPVETRRAGTARFQLGVTAGTFADAAQIEVPVYTPATTEAFAVYGEIDQGAIVQPVKIPADVHLGFGGIEITTSSTALQALTDAVLYLVRYPFECSEQVASRVLAVVALKDVLAAFAADALPSPDELVASMKKDLEHLARTQHSNGGWSFWGDGDPWPVLSIHVTHALARAKEKGYAVDANVLARATQYLRAIETHIPKWYGEEERRSLVAYALYVRKRLGDADVARAKKLVTEAGGVDKLPLEAVGWIWPTLGPDPEIRRVVGNRVTETADSAHFVTGHHDGDYVLLHSDRRVDAILLEALMGDQPRATLVPKLVKGLLAHRKAGHWQSTQENAFVLLALDRYFETYEKTTPDFVARAWLGDRYAGEHAFRGRTTERSLMEIPLAEAKSGDVVLAKDGPGRLYYRVGMQVAPKDLMLPAVDRGFTVTRTYEAVNSPGDVTREANGTWRIKAGAAVRVRLAMVARSRRYHVALVDPLPAGFEPMNPALAVTGDIPQDPKQATTDRYWYWSRAWYEHENLRDDRVEAFASLLWDGVHEYTYTARATTPGTFIAPAPKAEEMYTPETFGRGASERVIVYE